MEKSESLSEPRHNRSRLSAVLGMHPEPIARRETPVNSRSDIETLISAKLALSEDDSNEVLRQAFQPFQQNDVTMHQEHRADDEYREQSFFKQSIVHAPADPIVPSYYGQQPSDVPTQTLAKTRLFEHPAVPDQPALPSVHPSRTRVMLMADKIMWHYRDPTGRVQGPFSGIEMHEWYKGGFFQPSLFVKREEDLEFETLQSLASRIGNHREPFLVPQPSRTQTQIIPPRSTTTLAGWSQAPILDHTAGLYQVNNQDMLTHEERLESPGMENSQVTTLAADKQNALEQRKQEEQYARAKISDYIQQPSTFIHGDFQQQPVQIVPQQQFQTQKTTSPLKALHQTQYEYQKASIPIPQSYEGPRTIKPISVQEKSSTIVSRSDLDHSIKNELPQKVQVSTTGPELEKPVISKPQTAATNSLSKPQRKIDIPQVDEIKSVLTGGQESSGMATPKKSSVAPWATAIPTERQKLSFVELQEQELQNVREAAAKKAESIESTKASASFASKFPDQAQWGNSAWNSASDKQDNYVQEKTLLEIQKEQKMEAQKSSAKQVMTAASVARGGDETGWQKVGREGRPKQPVQSSQPVKPNYDRIGVVPVTVPIRNSSLSKPVSSTPAKDAVAQWCRSALKNINEGVDKEGFVQMLLSLPVDSPETLEIISDSIYTNSSTIDGRRFALEFLSRRKGIHGTANSSSKKDGSGASGKDDSFTVVGRRKVKKIT